MSRFADVLDRLATTNSITKLDWVTVQNEPNTAPKPGHVKAVTPEGLEDMYRRLDAHLTHKGLRSQIRFMGGDLIEGSKDTTSPLHHRRWFEYMSEHMADLIDAYSAHVYWDYQDVRRFQFRLSDTLQIVTSLANRKPVFITEYGIRSADRIVNGQPNGIDPGNYKDGTPLGKTNIAAFQQAWFQILAAQMGYAGTIKWDGFFGKYDSGTSAYYAIGPPGPDGWELSPMYFLLQLFTMTTESGWRVVEIKQSNSSEPTKHLAAFAGPTGGLTILGLDSRGASLNTTSPTKIDYTIGGLPAHTSFALVLWNRAGGGHLVVDRTITTDGGSVAKITVPLHSVFALTTKTLPPS
jgi:hypothetical protein